MADRFPGEFGKRDAEVAGCRNEDLGQVMADYGIDDYATVPVRIPVFFLHAGVVVLNSGHRCCIVHPVLADAEEKIAPLRVQERGNGLGKDELSGILAVAFYFE